MTQANQHLILKDIHAIGSEIMDATDGRNELRFHEFC